MHRTHRASIQQAHDTTHAADDGARCAYSHGPGPTSASGKAELHAAQAHDERMETGAEYLPRIAHHPAQLRLLEVHAKFPL